MRELDRATVAAPPGSVAPDDRGWHAFLEMLSPEPELAAAAYASLRGRLVYLFRRRGLAAPEDLADETLERAVRKVTVGERIQSMTRYVCGIAQRLALEASRRQAKTAQFDDGAGARLAAPAVEVPESREQLESLERCLESLPGTSRDLLMRYYAADVEHVTQRKQLATELGIGLNALRIRVHRLRTALEQCMGHEREALA